MAKENMAVNEAVVNGAVNEAATNEVVTGALQVSREIYMAKKTKKKYHAYFVKCLIRGHETKADIVPQKMGKGMIDGGGFELLDYVFEGTDKVYIEREYEEYSQDGIKKERTIYTVWSADANGEVLKVSVTPNRLSDKAKLDAMFDAIA